MTERIDEAHKMVGRWLGTAYEPAARAYLAAQVEIAQRETEQRTNRRRST